MTVVGGRSAVAAGETNKAWHPTSCATWAGQGLIGVWAGPCLGSGQSLIGGLGRGALTGGSIAAPHGCTMSFHQTLALRLAIAPLKKTTFRAHYTIALSTLFAELVSCMCMTLYVLVRAYGRAEQCRAGQGKKPGRAWQGRAGQGRAGAGHKPT